MKMFNPQIYLQVFHKFTTIDSATIDLYQRRAILTVLSLLVIWTLFSINRSLDENEHKELLQLSTQSHYQLTREMAAELLASEKRVNRYQYFRVLRALHAEKHLIRVQEDIVKPTPKIVDRLLDQ